MSAVAGKTSGRDGMTAEDRTGRDMIIVARIIEKRKRLGQKRMVQIRTGKGRGVHVKGRER